MRTRVIAATTTGLLLFAFFPVPLLQWTGLFVVFVVATSAAWSTRTRTRLTVTRSNPVNSVFRFQNTQVDVQIRNGSVFPISHLSVVDPCGQLRANGRTNAVLSIPPGGSRRLRYSVRGMNRGVHETGPLRVTGTDPLGLFPWSETKGEPGIITVYPALHGVSLPYSRGLPAGNLSTPNPVYEDQTRFRSLRGYIRGDDPRRISWKATARTGQLHTTEYLPALSFPVVIILNLRSDHYEIKGRYHAVERNIETAASLAVHAQGIGQAVGMVISGDVGGTVAEHPFPQATGYGHTVQLLRALSWATLGPGYMGIGAVREALVQIPYGSRIFYVGPSLDAETVIAFATLARGETTLELLYTHRRTPEREPFIPSSVAVRSIPDHGAFHFA